MIENKKIDGTAIVYCQGAFNTPNGKTAHGLVRFTERYHVISVIDSRYKGRDAGEILDNINNNIYIYASLDEAFQQAVNKGIKINYFVIGLAPDGGSLPDYARKDIMKALELGMNIDNGLHDLLSEDAEIQRMASERGLVIRDLRRPLSKKELHFFSGKIDEVKCLKLAVLGTDSALGKRTTSWILVHALHTAGFKAEMIGTGQTAWMQGARYTTIMDSVINDFVAGEIEHTIHEAWKNENPDVIIIEGQGSLMNPAYPGGFEILAAGRPDYVILQHAPRRLDYDGFPGFPIHPLEHQINAIEVISGKKVIAITINHENISEEEIPFYCRKISNETGLPASDLLADGPDKLIPLIIPLIYKK